MRKIAKVLEGTVGITGDVSTAGRIDLAAVMYGIAKKHQGMAREVAGSDMAAELEQSLISILSAYTALEAYINMYGRDRLSQKVWQEKFFKRRASTESKWVGVPQRATGKSLNKGREPFKSFLELESLRKYIVHFNPRFAPLAPSKYGTVIEAYSKLTCEKAEWACRTVRRMIVALHKLDGSDRPGWLE